MTKTAGMLDYSDRTVPETKCAKCGCAIQPSPLGYNRKYCPQKCKRSARDIRERQSIKGRHADRGKQRIRTYVRNRLQTDEAFRDKHQASTAVYRKQVRDWPAEFKVKSGCVDCGYRGHFSALRLDHEGEKTIAVADARTSIRRLQEEISAGQRKVRCANCHSIKTWERKIAKSKGCDQ